MRDDSKKEKKENVFDFETLDIRFFERFPKHGKDMQILWLCFLKAKEKNWFEKILEKHQNLQAIEVFSKLLGLETERVVDFMEFAAPESEKRGFDRDTFLLAQMMFEEIDINTLLESLSIQKRARLLTYANLFSEDQTDILSRSKEFFSDKKQWFLNLWQYIETVEKDIALKKLEKERNCHKPLSFLPPPQEKSNPTKTNNKTKIGVPLNENISNNFVKESVDESADIADNNKEVKENSEKMEKETPGAEVQETLVDKKVLKPVKKVNQSAQPQPVKEVKEAKEDFVKKSQKVTKVKTVSTPQKTKKSS
jgi:hypothetical protein